MIQRMTMLTVLLALALLAGGAGDLAAHEKFRIVGTIASVKPAVIELLTKEGRKVWIGVDKKTVVTRDRRKVARTELKAGRTVVVDALGDDASDLVAREIKLVPALPSATPGRAVK